MGLLLLLCLSLCNIVFVEMESWCQCQMSDLTRQRLSFLQEDLQLAAELGKTLLERNKELEATIRHQQSIIEDQVQEIQYLTKQSTTLKEVNDNRLKVYEQLEISIAELELKNKTLEDENKEDKLKVKSLTTSVNQLETRCSDLQSTIEDLYAGNKNLANYAKIKKLSIASQAGDDAAAGLDSLAALPRVSRCSGPSSLDAHSSLLSGPESILSLPNDAAAAAVDAGDDGLATNEKLAINKVVKYFEHRLLNLQVENAKLKVEDDSGAFSSLASESPKPSPNHLLDISGSVDGDSLRVDSVQPVVAGNAGQNLCRKCLGSLEQVTPWALISEALTMVKGTMNIELGKFSVGLRRFLRHHRRQGGSLWLDKWLAGLLALVGLLSLSRQVLVALGLAWMLDGVFTGE